MFEDLLADGRDRRTLGQSRALASTKLDAADVLAAHQHIERHPDAGSYLLLFALAATDPAAYACVPAATRAAVLCDALRSLPFLNDFGHLVEGMRAGESTEALVAIGQPALPCLVALLHDTRPAPFFGSADTTLAAQYRRSDFAFRIVTRILGEASPFDADPGTRDARIAVLARRLEGVQ